MRILFITGEYPAMQGGVGDYTRRLSQALGELGADVHVLTHADAGGDHLRAPSAAYEPTVHAAMTSTGWALWGYALQAIRELQPDIVHIQYQSAAYGLRAEVNLLPWRLRRLRGRPPGHGAHLCTLTTFHDLRFPYLFPKAGPLRHQAVLALARQSDASVVTNPADWVRLQAAGLAYKLHPIPIGSNIRASRRPTTSATASGRGGARTAIPGCWAISVSSTRERAARRSSAAWPSWWLRAGPRGCLWSAARSARATPRTSHTWRRSKR
jgi:glycosyltransferase involved in cell wall biosynthesis